jgi:hypothetical protein
MTIAGTVGDEHTHGPNSNHPILRAATL